MSTDRILDPDQVLYRDGTIVEPEVGTVFKVSGQLRNSYGAAAGRFYDYAIIRARNGRWYTTGSSCPPFGMNWNAVLRFLETFIDPRAERLS